MKLSIALFNAVRANLKGMTADFFCLQNQINFHMAEGLLSVEDGMSALVQKDVLNENHEG